MFLIDENMTAREKKRRINETLDPIKLFCKNFGVQVQYENGISVVEVTEKIDELSELRDMPCSATLLKQITRNKVKPAFYSISMIFCQSFKRT